MIETVQPRERLHLRGSSVHRHVHRSSWQGAQSDQSGRRITLGCDCSVRIDDVSGRGKTRKETEKRDLARENVTSTGDHRLLCRRALCSESNGVFRVGSPSRQSRYLVRTTKSSVHQRPQESFIFRHWSAMADIPCSKLADGATISVHRALSGRLVMG